MNTAIIPAAADFDAVLRRTVQCSRYVQRLLDAEAALLPWLRAHYAQPCNAEEMAAWLAAMPAGDEESLACALRRLRKHVMLKLLTRDLGGLADLDEVMR